MLELPRATVEFLKHGSGVWGLQDFLYQAPRFQHLLGTCRFQNKFSAVVCPLSLPMPNITNKGATSELHGRCQSRGDTCQEQLIGSADEIDDRPLVLRT